MKIAVINEVSAGHRNADILRALEGRGLEVYNVGMRNPDQLPSLTYIHTGLMAALLLHTGAVDFVIGGCGTGQGFLNSAMQYNGVFCGLILEPLDAWLFSMINHGNCVSLALNKNYGWAADMQLQFIFDKLFLGESGSGYPPERSQSQRESREKLAIVSDITHRSLLDILPCLPGELLAPVIGTKAFMELVQKEAKECALKSMILSLHDQ